MSAYKLKKITTNFEKMKARIQYYIDNKITWLPATSRTPGAVWCDISTILEESIREQLSNFVGRPLHPIFWLCDYRGCTELEIHRDNPGNEYPIHSRFTIIVMLDGIFEMTIWEDDQKSVIDKVIVRPGEFIILNNCQYYHSGKVLEGNKLSLHAYPIIPEIDGNEFSSFRFDVEKYV